MRLSPAGRRQAVCGLAARRILARARLPDREQATTGCELCRQQRHLRGTPGSRMTTTPPSYKREHTVTPVSGPEKGAALPGSPGLPVPWGPARPRLEAQPCGELLRGPSAPRTGEANPRTRGVGASLENCGSPPGEGEPLQAALVSSARGGHPGSHCPLIGCCPVACGPDYCHFWRNRRANSWPTAPVATDEQS